MVGLPVSGWLLRRGLQAVMVLAIALTILFFLMRAAPGDPLARATENRPLSAAELATLRARYGLDQPVTTQFVAFLGGLIEGDLGVSIEYGRPVTGLLIERLPATLLLGGSVLLLNFTVGLWLGVRQAVRRGRAEDRWLTAVSLVGYATPSFWLGLVLAWLVGIKLRLLPAAGMQDPLLSFDASLALRAGDVLRHLVLPALTLSIVSIAATMRYQRTAMLEILTLPFMVTGSVFVEAVFAWPGLGSLAAAAVWGRDYPVLMGASMLVAALVVAGGFITDVAYALLDP